MEKRSDSVCTTEGLVGSTAGSLTSGSGAAARRMGVTQGDGAHCPVVSALSQVCAPQGSTDPPQHALHTYLKQVQGPGGADQRGPEEMRPQAKD